MPSSGMQYWHRKLHRSVTEMRRSRTVRPYVSTRTSLTRSGYCDPRECKERYPSRSTSTSPPHRDSLAVGNQGQGVGAAPWPATGAIPGRPPSGRGSDRRRRALPPPGSGEACRRGRRVIAVVGHPDHLEAVPVGAAEAHHLAQPRAGEQLETDHGRHRVARAARTPACVRRRRRPTAWPGRMATCIQAMSPDLVEDLLDVVEVAHADAAAGDEGVARRHRLGNGGADHIRRRRGPGRGRRLEARLAAQAEQGQPVRVADLSGCSGAGPRPARRRWRARPPGPGRRRPLFPSPTTGQHAEVARGRAPSRQGRPPGRRRCRRPGGADAGPRRPAGATQTWSPSLVVISTMTMASAPAGSGAPVMIRIASPGPDRGGRRLSPAARVPTTSRRAGRSLVAPAVSAARTA